MSPRRLLLLAFVAPFVCGCASQPAINNAAHAAPEFPVTPRELESLPANSYCEVEVFPDEAGRSMQYTGRVVRADGERLTLDAIQLTQRRTRRLPILGDSQIPAMRSMFGKAGIDTELIEGEKTLLREQIAEVRLLDPRTSAWYASRRRTAQQPQDEKAGAEDDRASKPGSDPL